ncbi:hypothetical protein HK100_008085 [Physocladia obscura]|uniref:Translocon-associated protein subunit beta n=1 Tax=Physocladia obscura TaxID=109957 RepID=A0AAD5T730_9FUNG|nr:hypothetical protein HK100_008085 [Physocladia obscura]
MKPNSLNMRTLSVLNLFMGVIFVALTLTVEAGVVVHKTFKERVLVTGRNATIAITAFNTGSLPISNFIVEDKTFRNFTLYAPVAGKHSRLFKTIEAGKSASFWFVVKPTASGTHQDQPAFYRYKDSNDEQHTGYSSYFQAFPVFTEQDALKLGIQQKSGGKWSILIVVFGLVAAFVGYVYQETVKEAAKAKIAAEAAAAKETDL